MHCGFSPPDFTPWSALTSHEPTPTSTAAFGSFFAFLPLEQWQDGLCECCGPGGCPTFAYAISGIRCCWPCLLAKVGGRVVAPLFFYSVVAPLQLLGKLGSLSYSCCSRLVQGLLFRRSPSASEKDVLRLWATPPNPVLGRFRLLAARLVCSIQCEYRVRYGPYTVGRLVHFVSLRLPTG